MKRLIDSINNPSDLKKLPQEKLSQAAEEIRRLIIDTVSRTGGHLAPSLGVVELTTALHYVFEAPRDFIFWDVGHQSYAHKILTGRRDNFHTLRQAGGISGFPKKGESVYDHVTCGHSSTSISTALGVAAARDIKGERHKVVAVIGDGALAGGMAFEALNHAGETGKDLIVVLNDNEMSISRPIGGLSKYLNRILSAPVYNKVRKEVEGLVKRIPRYGFRVYRAARKLEEGLKNLLIPGMLFEEMGFRYFGPINGHDINLLVGTLKNIKELNEPILLHVITKKGMGYKYAEEHPEKFHGTGPFEVKNGNSRKDGEDTYTQAFGRKMIELAEGNEKIIAVTAAMPDGTGLSDFAARFPARFFDVGIAEQHAVTFSAGLALNGFVPVAAIYSTFLQRAYDQLIHDVALQNLHVVFAVDRAGLVGEDGPTHHGPFDIVYLRSIPNMTIMAPKDQRELCGMLEFAVEYAGPAAIRYPRGGLLSDYRLPVADCALIRPGKAEVLRDGGDLAIIALGSMAYPAMEAAEALAAVDINVAVVNARFAKPFDTALFLDLGRRVNKLLIVEEGIVDGGFGCAVMEFFRSQNIEAQVRLLGLPNMFIEHGPRKALLEKYGLSKEAIVRAAKTLSSRLPGAAQRVW